MKFSLKIMNFFCVLSISMPKSGIKNTKCSGHTLKKHYSQQQKRGTAQAGSASEFIRFAAMPETSIKMWKNGRNYVIASKPHGEEIFSRNFRSSTRSNRKLLRAGENEDLCKNIKAVENYCEREKTKIYAKISKPWINTRRYRRFSDTELHHECLTHR